MYRKCKFENENKCVVYGYLSLYGTNYEELRDGIGQCSAAIIEDCDGKMHLVPVTKIQMLPNDFEDIKYDDHKRIFGF